MFEEEHYILKRNIISAILALFAFAMITIHLPVYAQDINLLMGSQLPDNAIWLDTLNMNNISQAWGDAQARKSAAGNPMSIKGIKFEHGIGTHAESYTFVNLKGAAVRFETAVGVDSEEDGLGSVCFQVYVDNLKKYDSGILKGTDSPKLVSVDLTGAKKMVLVVTTGNDGGSHDHADWAGAMLILNPKAKEKPEIYKWPLEPVIPMASGVSAKPAIHGPRIVGTTPGRDFLFLIPATGRGPLTYSASNLPSGLKLDSKTGIISGSLQKEGEYIVELTVSGVKGVAKRKLKIVGGDHKLALTPPMGWNSWNIWAWNVDASKVRAAADAMVKSGLAAHGFQYINIDDSWESANRDSNGEISTNERFGDMKALADYVHSKGLKIGVYSSPGPKTCANFLGSYQHEYKDAKTWAKWGIDYVKYDWCSYATIAKNDSLDELQKPYKLMGDALDKCGRDIVFSLCQYGMGDVWKWGAEVGGNCWRTTTDITDNWYSVKGIAFSQNGHEKYAGPGHWNDPDMLVVGNVGWSSETRPTKLTPNEQVLHITMWSLLSSPLLIGCDMTNMDKLTYDLLSNDEVLDVNQDPLGKPAGCKHKDGNLEVWSRPLWDGTTAVGLFNLGMEDAKVTAKWADLGISGRQMVRDLWQQKNLGKFDGSFTSEVPAHGAIMVKIGTPNRTDW